MIVRNLLLLSVLVLASVACGGVDIEMPPPGVGPVEMPVAALTNQELAKAFAGKRVHTVGAFAHTQPFVTYPGFASGYIAANFYQATPEGSAFKCDMGKMGMEPFVAPTAMGAAWASASHGDVFEITGVVHPTFLSGWVQVETMKPVGKCQ
jgi:hypothetical protein